LRPAVPAMGELLRMFPYGPYGVAGRLRQVAQVFGGLHHVGGAVLARARGDAPGTAFALSVMAEQPPDRASRVTLAGKTDRVGLPLPHLHWAVGRREFEDARRSTELLREELRALGVGEVVSLWDRDEERPPVVTGGWHHMGTTRMSASASEGVVDGDCRVHGIDNLYVTGSSVFPTSGYANPTLTLVALAVRLGRHLARSPFPG
jgi:choline dehydrogenase-like flavoprotein